jgi:Pyruvate/2-oxoacid:ferredoxin oxidoreductase delta subunit
VVEGGRGEESEEEKGREKMERTEKKSGKERKVGQWRVEQVSVRTERRREVGNCKVEENMKNTAK